MKIMEYIRKTALFLFHSLFLGLPLVFTFVNDELFEFNKLLIVYAVAIVLFGLWIISSIAHKKLYGKRTPFDIPIILFATSQIISTIFSIEPHTSVFGYYTRFNGGLLSVLSYIMCFYGFVFFIPKTEVRKLLFSLLLGGVAATLYAFPEHFGFSPSCFLISGTFDVSCWVQDVQSRVFGTFGQPNWLAAYLITIIPLAIYRLFSAGTGNKTIREQEDTLLMRKTTLVSSHSRTNSTTQSKFFSPSIIVPSLQFMLFTAVLFFTASRSGLLSLFFVYALYAGSFAFVYFIAKRHEPLSMGIHKLLIFFVFPLLLTIGVGLLFDTPLASLAKRTVERVGLQKPAQVQEIQEKPMTGTQLEIGGSDSGKIRTVVWKGAVQVFMRYPLFGSGVETFGYSYFKDRPVEHNLLSEWDFLYNKAHNEFLNYLATTGIVGFSAYLLMYGSFVFFPLLFVRAKKERTIQEIFLFVSLSAGLGGLAVSNFFGFSTVVVSLLTFLYPAIAWVLHDTQTKENDPFVDTNRMTAIGVICIGIVIAQLMVYKIWKADFLYAQGKEFYSRDDIGSSIETLQSAIELMPEATYYDELSFVAAKGAVTLHLAGESTASASLASFAIAQSDTAIAKNSVHTNFYKTRARVFLILAQITPTYYTQAIQALNESQSLSPTDPKAPYNLALIAKEQGNTEAYVDNLEKTLALRPIDEPARYAYALYLEEEQRYEEAKQQYEYMLQFINPENTVAKDRLASISAKLKK